MPTRTPAKPVIRRRPDVDRLVQLQAHHWRCEAERFEAMLERSLDSSSRRYARAEAARYRSLARNTYRQARHDYARHYGLPHEALGRFEP